jgi:peptidoglycan hydrolase-like protein with peptidoglycan-binding domain
VLPSPQTTVELPRAAIAGTMLVAATPRTWEYGSPTAVSWFPAGSAASAVATPRPGTRITPGTPITLTFNKPVAKALGSDRPPVSPATPGVWHTLNSHAIVFRPTGYGYGMASTVTIALPHDVMVVGGQHTATSSTASWTVPGGSPVRLQQLLSLLNYLPLKFHYAHGGGVPLDPTAQEQAAVNPPAGRFSFKYPSVPPAFKSMWSPGANGVITRGALMAFQNDHGLTADGIAGPAVWRALIAAVIGGKPSSFGYTWVNVSKETSPESISVWHNGKTVVSGPVNTGISVAPTASGTFPVFEHLPETTMSGTNPDGSHYSDPGIQWVSYFNGGDALHAFTRAQFGFPQSLGCVEMPLDEAAQVYPFTPIGTIVNVA